jgi:hypothetical protein
MLRRRGRVHPHRQPCYGYFSDVKVIRKFVQDDLSVQARELFGMFDQLIHFAQNRRIRLLREISIRREFARRAGRVVRAVDSFNSASI